MDEGGGAPSGSSALRFPDGCPCLLLHSAANAADSQLRSLATAGARTGILEKRGPGEKFLRLLFLRPSPFPATCAHTSHAMSTMSPLSRSAPQSLRSDLTSQWVSVSKLSCGRWPSATRRTPVTRPRLNPHPTTVRPAARCSGKVTSI